MTESRRDVKTSNVDSEENCDIESSGGCADDSEDSISDDEGLADNSVSQIETDIQDNMTELWHRVADTVIVQNFQCKCKLRAQVRETSTLTHCEKPGCIAQFSTDEILARRLNVAEFNEGEVVFIIV